MRMAGEIFSVHQENVGVTVIVVIEEGAAGAHGFGQPLFSEGAVVMGEVNSGWSGDVAKVGLLGARGQREQNPPQRHRGTEKS
jgi:hypothetical protein